MNGVRLYYIKNMRPAILRSLIKWDIRQVLYTDVRRILGHGLNISGSYCRKLQTWDIPVTSPLKAFCTGHTYYLGYHRCLRARSGSTLPSACDVFDRLGRKACVCQSVDYIR